MRHVRDDGDELVMTVGRERHDVGPELATTDWTAEKAPVSATEGA